MNLAETLATKVKSERDKNKREEPSFPYKRSRMQIFLLNCMKIRLKNMESSDIGPDKVFSTDPHTKVFVKLRSRNLFRQDSEYDLGIGRHYEVKRYIAMDELSQRYENKYYTSKESEPREVLEHWKLLKELDISRKVEM